MKNIKAYTFILLLSMSLIFPTYAGDKINEIGKIIYSKDSSSYYFIYLKEDKIISHILAIKNQNDLLKLKSLVNKSVHIEGDLSWIRGDREAFSLNEKLTIFKLDKFELDVLAFDSRKIIQQDNLISHEKMFKNKLRNQDSPKMTFEISDTTANSLIATASVALGILTGPISLIPAAVFGIQQLIQ